LQQRRKCICVETLLSDPYHRWAALTAGCQQGMEIRIERDADARIGARSPHADFGHVNHVPPALAQQSGRGSR
jgi:hypothetical protein